MAKSKKRKKAKVVNMQPKMSLDKYIKLKARNLEIHEVFIDEGEFASGNGQVIFVRKKRNGQKLVGIYLVDIWCLGVKDTFYRLFEDFEYDDFIQSFGREGGMNMIPSTVDYVCNVIYGAVEYAEDLGIDPIKNFGITEYILPDVEEIEYMEIEFGDNGKPHFIPFESDNKAVILNRLNKAVGKDGYYYTEVEYFADEDLESDYVDAADE